MSRTYTAIRNKKNGALRVLTHRNLKTAPLYVKLYWLLCWGLRITSAVLVAATIIWIMQKDNVQAFDFIYIFLNAGVPTAISIFFANAYRNRTDREFAMQEDEELTVNDDGIVLTFSQYPINKFEFTILFKNIQKMEYDAEAKMITIGGTVHISMDKYYGTIDTVVWESAIYSFLNIYEIDIAKLIQDHMSSQEQ